MIDYVVNKTSNTESVCYMRYMYVRIRAIRYQFGPLRLLKNLFSTSQYSFNNVSPFVPPEKVHLDVEVGGFEHFIVFL